MGSYETDNFYQPEREPRGENLEHLLHDERLIHGAVVEFAADTFRFYTMEDTGETRLVMDVEVPEKAPVVQAEAASLSELLQSEHPPERPSAGAQREERETSAIDTTELDAWKENLIQPEQIITAAKEELQRREVLGDSETIPCVNCNSEPYKELDCIECEAYRELQRMEGEEFEDDEADANPDCKLCDGSGTRLSECPYCEGTGETAKYPYLILENEMSGEQRVLKLDVAALIDENEAGIEWGGFTKVYSEDNQSSEQILKINIADYIDRNIAEIGVDKHNAMMIWEEGLTTIPSSHSNTEALRAHFGKHRGNTKTGFHLGHENMTAQEALENAQRGLARAHAWPRGKIKDEHGVAFAEQWTMRPLRPIEESLEDLKNAVAERGYTLGFSYSFIATGEVGPTWFVLGDGGEKLAKLDQDYDVRASIENAWLALGKLDEEGF